MCPDSFNPLDLFACWGHGAVSKTISLGTSSPFRPWNLSWAPSHIAFAAPYRGDVVWVESTTLAHRPCLIAGRVISGVQVHRPEDRIQDYRGKVAVYRLVPPFLPQEEQYLWRYIQPFLGKGYDRSTVLLAGTKVLRFSRLLPGAWGADLNELFCSELTAAILMQMNKMNWDNPTRYSPARLLRTVVRNGTYTRVKV